LRLRSRLLVAALAVVAALPLVGLMASPALAVETASNTNVYGPFTDGNYYWIKVALEVDTAPSPDTGRAVVTAWCEPNNVAGGSKVLCDAVSYGDSGGGGYLAVENWDESFADWLTNDILLITNPASFTDYSPPLAGYRIVTAWDNSGEGADQYRANVNKVRVASSNQWSAWRVVVTPTWNGTL
jgi:hypothetical protein